MNAIRATAVVVILGSLFNWGFADDPQEQRPATAQNENTTKMSCESGNPDALPANRHGHRIHVIGDELLVIGGFSRNGDPADDVSRSCLRYGFATNQWTPAFVERVVFSPDGTRLAAAGADNSVQVCKPLFGTKRLAFCLNAGLRKKSQFHS